MRMQLVQRKHAECSSVSNFPTPLLRDDDGDSDATTRSLPENEGNMGKKSGSESL